MRSAGNSIISTSVEKWRGKEKKKNQLCLDPSTSPQMNQIHFED